MTQFYAVLTWVEYLGTIAFAVSGAIVGIRKHMDIFGVAILGLVTACGGGLIRDMVLNVMPAAVFRNPVFATIAIITSLVVFLPPIRKRVLQNSRIQELALFWADTLGLAAFTITGLRTAIIVYPGGSAFFYCFLAVITACGGGLLRDVMAQEMPAIFVKKIYAVASLAGALTSKLLWRVSPLGAFLAGAALVVLIRFLAMHFRWNLPRA